MPEMMMTATCSNQMPAIFLQYSNNIAHLHKQLSLKQELFRKSPRARPGLFRTSICPREPHRVGAEELFDLFAEFFGGGDGAGLCGADGHVGLVGLDAVKVDAALAGGVAEDLGELVDEARLEAYRLQPDMHGAGELFFRVFDGKDV